MIHRANTVLSSAGVQEGAFELQFAAYRNYSSGPTFLLQHSGWEVNADNLRQFIESIHSDGGQGNEAIEVGFQHVNEELLNGSITQVLLIGDMPPNTHRDIELKRKTINWSSTKYAEPTYYLDELRKMIENEVIVHSFYVCESARHSFEDIARRAGGECHALDINSQAGAELLTKLVTEQILRAVGGSKRGEEFVQKYRDLYGGYL